MTTSTAYKSNDGVSERAVALKNITNHETIDENTEYIGEANPGTLDSDAGWFIYKRFVSGIEKVRFAEGSRKFDKVWNDRASYIYS
jgi:hypothetical protein